MEPCIAYVSESSARSLIGRPSETVFRRVEIAKVVASFSAAALDWKDHGHNQMLAALTAVGERQSWLNLRKTACRRWVLTKCQKTVRRDTIAHKQAVLKLIIGQCCNTRRGLDSKRSFLRNRCGLVTAASHSAEMAVVTECACRRS